MPSLSSRLGALSLALAAAAPLALASNPQGASSRSALPDAVPIRERNIDVSREEANRHPRSERDQTIVEGWPLYRTPRGQEAFNEAMATLRATEGPAPPPAAFKGCTRLDCAMTLPAIDRAGWLAPGRLWVSPSEFVLIARSPRRPEGYAWRRRSAGSLRYFVFHEFHNSSHNTDIYDTISSHRGSIFVPFYMSKQATDARGRRFVVVVQTAPWDVVSIHATNLGSAGPGIEVAMNRSDDMEPLQGLAGILIAHMVKTAAPRLEVTNHRGEEGLTMLEAWQERLARLRARPALPRVALPFVPAQQQRLAAATGDLSDVLGQSGAVPRVPVTGRAIVPPQPTLVWPGFLARPPQPAATVRAR